MIVPRVFGALGGHETIKFQRKMKLDVHDYKKQEVSNIDDSSTLSTR